MREQFGHLHYFSKETALATLTDAGYEVVDYSYTDDYEFYEPDAIESLRSKMIYALRRFLFPRKPELALSLFTHFRMLVLARGGVRGPA